MTRFFIDCEFDGHNGPLLSMAIVPEHGDGLYMVIIDGYAPKDPSTELEGAVQHNAWWDAMALRHKLA